MKHSLPFIFSLAILAAAFAPAYAQQDKNALDSLNAQVLDSTKAIIDTLKVQDSIAVRKRVKKERVKRPDSLKIKIRSGLQFYLDYGKVATLISDFEQKFEIGIGYQFSNRFQPNFQYGTGSIETGAAIENGEYASEGSYWNVGLNYLIPLDNINTLFFGVKYGEASFDDSGSYEVTSELWPTFTDSFSRSGFSASWYSILFGSEKRFMDGKLILGGQTGVRFILERDEEDFIDIYTIPGYGLTTNDGSPFLNLYIKYQLSF